MSKSLFAVILFASITLHQLFAWEPPALVATKERVRMATLIVVGKIETVSVGKRESGQLVNASEHYTLKKDEMLWAVIKVERVLYSSLEERPFYSSQRNAQTVDVRFGDYHTNLDEFRELKQQSGIFYLTFNPDKSRPYRYPFYDYTNLFDPITKEGEVTRLIAAFDAAK